MSHKSEAHFLNITKDRLIYNKTGHFAILVNRRGVCKIFENGGVQLLGLIIYDDGVGGGGRILIHSVYQISMCSSYY